MLQEPGSLPRWTPGTDALPTCVAEPGTLFLISCRTARQACALNYLEMGGDRPRVA